MEKKIVSKSETASAVPRNIRRREKPFPAQKDMELLIFMHLCSASKQSFGGFVHCLLLKHVYLHILYFALINLNPKLQSCAISPSFQFSLLPLFLFSFHFGLHLIFKYRGNCHRYVPLIPLSLPQSHVTRLSFIGSIGRNKKQSSYCSSNKKNIFFENMQFIRNYITLQLVFNSCFLFLVLILIFSGLSNLVL